jgi:hypothetical protein
MIKQLYFALGLTNNVLLILIFILRKNHLPFIQSYGWIYLLLSLPAVYLIFSIEPEQMASKYRIFLMIFIAFLVLEGIFDFILKVPFRDNWLLLTPYLILYYGMNYGFIVMTWKYSFKQGLIMLVFFAIQIVANIITH